MERHSKSLIEEELQIVLNELDGNKMLSEGDKVELKDHFLCEIEDLVGIGLREEEAFLVAKKRFGVLEEVKMEYEKVKPRFEWMRYGIIGVVVFCIAKIMTISINMIAQSFWMAYYYFDPVFVVGNIALDVPLRIVLVVVFSILAGRYISKQKFNSLISFWQFPIIYLFLEFVSRLFTFLFPMSFFKGSMILSMQFFTNNAIMNYTLLVIIMIFSSYKMYKLKVIDMEYV